MSKKRERLWCDKSFAELLRVKAAKNGFSSPAKYTEYLARSEQMESFFKDAPKDKKKRGGRMYDSFF